MKDGSAALSRARTWDTFFADDHVAQFRRSLYLEAYGDEYPAELGTDGYVTRSQLNQLAQALCVGRGAKIADLGCGRGGPGQVVARITGAALVGIDFSEVALQRARDRARQLSIFVTARKPEGNQSRSVRRTRRRPRLRVRGRDR